VDTKGYGLEKKKTSIRKNGVIAGRTKKKLSLSLGGGQDKRCTKDWRAEIN